MNTKTILLLLFIYLAGFAQESKLEMQLESSFINLPVTYDEEDFTSIEIEIDGKSEFFFEIFLADKDADFWVFLDVSEFRGKTAIFKSDRDDKDEALNKIYQSDEREYLADLYKEKHRPQLHFSTMRGWINDPNGLVYYDGEYHLYFQHYPFGYYWGQPHWGHAVSTDLVHWKQLPDVLYRHELAGIWSGSSVVDYNNTAGFKTGDTDPIIAFYTTSTYYGDDDAPTQNLAYSNDRGRTFTMYEDNPVIGDRREVLGTYNARDPKVIWHEETEKWVMVVFERIGNSIFTSDNLKDWEYQSHIETFWECPELFELPVDGDPYEITLTPKSFIFGKEEIKLNPELGENIETVQLFFDRTVVEIFVNGGKVCATKVVYPDFEDLDFEIITDNGNPAFKDLKVWEMKSIW